MCAKRRISESGNPSGAAGNPSGAPDPSRLDSSIRDPARHDPARPGPVQPDPAKQDQAWRDFVDRSRRESLPFEAHLAAFRRIFAGRRPEDGPPVAWAPDETVRRRSNLQASMEAVGLEDFADFHAWSVRDPSAFWTHTLERLGIVFAKPPDAILDLGGGVRDSRGGVRAPQWLPHGGVRDPRWLPGAELNIVDSCFTADPDRPAVVTPGPNGRSCATSASETTSTTTSTTRTPTTSTTRTPTTSTTTYGELERLVNRAANGLRDRGLAPGRAIALYMPLNLECVVAYLAIIRAGSRVVSIADSFPAVEVRRRMAIAGARCIVTMDRFVRAGKSIPLYDTVVEAGVSTVIVVPSDGDGRSRGVGQQSGAVRAVDVDSPDDDVAVTTSDAPRLRPGDIAWADLQSGDDTFESVTGDPYRTTNILFSSGTTGESKAIPWNHLTPIKSAMDGFYHQDIHGDDVTAWPTNIGWMMGPWLIYATLVNGACMALYPDATHTPEYLRFIRRAGVTMQGVIPSLVRTWRRGGMDAGSQGDMDAGSQGGMDAGSQGGMDAGSQGGMDAGSQGGMTEGQQDDVDDGRHSGAADGIDWPSVRVFSSTGEPASRTDYLWLMSRGGYRAPVIEYLGGTEIGGGHLACTVLQPCSPAAFTTANLGVDFVILDETGAEVEEGATGELFLMPPALGMSQRLLNGDHDEVYYGGCPAGPRGEVLRRHGDNTQRLHHGYYRAQGRADDGMNLGGIMVSPLELERIIDGHPAVYESAAVAIQPEGEGTERLVVFIVPEGGNGTVGSHTASTQAEEQSGSPPVGKSDASPGVPVYSQAGLDPKLDPDSLKSELQALVSSGLNPLFKIYRVVIADELPHTASGKLVRRILRDRIRPGS